MPVLDVLFSMLFFFLFIAWIWVLISVIGDIFRSDMGGAAKAVWVLFVMLLPWLGVLIYLIANGDAMTERTAKQAAAMEEAQRAYIKDAAGTTSPADELTKLAALKDSGAISDAEYQKLRAQVIG
ncbi:MAG: SHOCT domain-containing protein [Acidimicrobiia bacterium]|nr:SHOCT domain-containing protein [Acidimicrobiia bacterium]